MRTPLTRLDAYDNSAGQSTLIDSKKDGNGADDANTSQKKDAHHHDHNLEDSPNKQKWYHMLIISERSQWKALFDWMVSIIVAYTCFTVVLYMCFDIKPEGWIASMENVFD